MKRIVFFFLLILSLSHAYAETSQKLFSCVSGIKELYSGMSNSAAFQIGTDVYPDSIQYCLNLGLNEGQITMPKGAKLLIKYKTGEILELENSVPITASDISHIRNNVVDHYEIYPSYPITLEQLNKLASEEIEKIRIELTGGYIDRKVKKVNKKVGTSLQSLIDYINQKKNSSIYDGF